MFFFGTKAINGEKMFLPNNFAVWKKMLSFAPEKNESNEHKAE